MNTAIPTGPTWCTDWRTVARHHVDWWRGAGLVAQVFGPRDQPRVDVEAPEPPADHRQRRAGAGYLPVAAEANLARTEFLVDAIPLAHNNVGAGDLAAILGAGWHFEPSTVWFEPCIEDPDRYGKITFDPASPVFGALDELIRAQVDRAAGRYLVAMPDLVENLDILAAMRDPQTTMIDLVERPDWVSEKIHEINVAYFEVFDRWYELIKEPAGGNAFTAFAVWGPGKTAKVQCDASAMIGPDMFGQFVAPGLKEQCDQLDQSVYHLDGPECICHLDHLLAIDSLNAIQYTPGARNPKHSDPRWFEFYHNVLDGGKALLLPGIAPEETQVLLDELGPRGLHIRTHCPTLDEAHRIAELVESYR